VERSNKGTLRVPQDLERYRSLVDDWSGFVAAVSRPLPRCVRTQTQRIAAGELEALLTADGMQPRPLAWANGAFRLGCSEGLGRRWWYLAGLCHSQEEASMLPVQLLDPRPGDRVLDLCAAPGSKTAQIALALESEGTVVANDSSVSRLRALRSTLDRLGLANVSVTRCEGSVFPRGCGTFDRILVDAPCAGDGTSRRRPDARRAGLDRDYTQVQKRLLRRAVRLCRPGGRIVYSTCSFAPEENEMVVDAILGEDSRRELKLVASKVTGLKTAHGVTSWCGTDLHPDSGLPFDSGHTTTTPEASS
jgi:16S rRNA C967 or C1407 C5-methylase (RsmB/RsmF family)